MAYSINPSYWSPLSSDIYSANTYMGMPVDQLLKHLIDNHIIHLESSHVADDESYFTFAAVHPKSIYVFKTTDQQAAEALAKNFKLKSYIATGTPGYLYTLDIPEDVVKWATATVPKFPVVKVHKSVGFSTSLTKKNAPSEAIFDALIKVNEILIDLGRVIKQFGKVEFKMVDNPAVTKVLISYFTIASPHKGSNEIWVAGHEDAGMESLEKMLEAIQQNEAKVHHLVEVSDWLPGHGIRKTKVIIEPLTAIDN